MLARHGRRLSSKGWCMMSNKIPESFEIILNEDDFKSLIGKKIKSGGRNFTATEVEIYGAGIGREIIGNAIKNRFRVKQ